MSDDSKDVDTMVAERASVLGHARRMCSAIGAHIRTGRIAADAGTELQQAIRNFAEDVAIGLHRDGLDPVEVRHAMKPIVMAARADKGEE